MLALSRFWSRKLPAQGNSTHNWEIELQATMAKLAQVNHSTEADFLAIGAKLSSFVAAARGISTEANAIKDSLSGDTGSSLHQALRTVFDDSLNRELDATAVRELTGMRQAVSDIRKSLWTFEQVGPSFQVMAALARIETAHLGSAGLDLGHLADEFRSAGDGIKSRVQHILNGASTLETSIESALKDVALFDERSRHALQALLATANQGLNEFQARQEKSAETALQLAAGSAEIAKSISDLVASIQFHDITRQQVEHIVDSLRGLDGKSALPDTALALVHLQSAQLENASNAFAGAVARMDRHLEEIAGRIGRMLAESTKLLGPAGTPESSFYLQMQECFRAIATASAERTALDRQTAKAFAGLEETLQSLKESASEIHRVELQLRWLAINAAISAAHIGTSGAPLESIAAAMYGLLADCEKSSRAADASICSIADIFRSAVKSSNVSEQLDGDSLLQRLRSQIDELHALEQRAATRTGELASSTSRLSAEVEQLRHEFSAGRVFGAAAADCCAVLRSIQEQAGFDRSSIDHAHLASLKEQYTMQSERDVHENIFASPTVVTPDTEPQPAAATEFDDNVELF